MEETASRRSGWNGRKRRLKEVGRGAWRVSKAGGHLGLTGFGGPPVHFAIFHEKYVNKLRWIDEEIYQELFSLSQALSGPASTKMLYCINLIREGFLPALVGFLLWSLPGALSMFGLCIGVSQIGETLPRAVYALLSGLNASVVGVIALAAVQLSNKAITDDLTRILVFLGASAGLLYNALWYFPVLIAAAGVATVVFDSCRSLPFVRRLLGRVRRRRETGREPEEAPAAANEPVINPVVQGEPGIELSPATGGEAPSPILNNDTPAGSAPPAVPRFKFSWKLGSLIIGLFFASFIATIVLRATLRQRPLLFSLFANLYLAGTIIFGGGPVVVPLLREYIVAEGWVSARDFLIGLAVIQALPGPNFNFAVYLGGLTASNAGMSPVAGALIGFVGIFAPGMILCHGVIRIWPAVRSISVVKSALRGINAAAVGLIYTAVYRLWQIGFIDEDFTQGRSLANDPWWVVITATSYVGSAWFRLSPPVVIVLGAVLGLVRYGVVG